MQILSVLSRLARRLWVHAPRIPKFARCVSGFLSLALLLTAGCAKKTPEELLTEGHRLLQEGDVLQAEFNYQEILERYPDSEATAQARFWLAACYRAEKQFDLAREQLDLFIPAVGGVATDQGLQATMLKIDSYVEEKKIDKAIEEAVATSNSLVMLPPQLQDWFQFNISTLFMINNEEEKVLEICRGLISREPSEAERHAEPLDRMAEIYVKREEPEKAVEIYEDYLDRYPETPFKSRVLFLLGTHQERNGQAEAAQKSYEASEAEVRRQLEAALSAEEKTRLLMELAGQKDNRGNVEAAQEALRTIIDQYPVSQLRPTAMMHSAHLSHRQGQTGKATEMLQQMIEGYPDSPQSNQASQMLEAIRTGALQGLQPTTGTLLQPSLAPEPEGQGPLLPGEPAPTQPALGQVDPQADPSSIQVSPPTTEAPEGGEQAAP